MGFYCEHKILRTIYLGHRRNTCSFYIYEYTFGLNYFAHVFAHVWCDISRLLPSLMSISFTVDSMIRRNHVYKEIWDSNLGEELPCKLERNNVHDPFAVSVLKSGIIVSHIPE